MAGARAHQPTNIFLQLENLLFDTLSRSNYIIYIINVANNIQGDELYVDVIDVIEFSMHNYLMNYGFRI